MENMKCDCGGQYETLHDQTYHFIKPLSGLDNVYLEHMTLSKCQQCGDISPWFYRAGELQATIARALVSLPYLLTGDEIRFLRKERGMKAKDFAALLRTDPTTLSRWEDDKQARSPQNDALIRLVYVQLFNERETGPFPEKMLDKLTALSERSENFTIWVDTKSPMSYRYNKGEEKAA